MQRADDLVEEAGEGGPRTRDLGGVDDDAAPPQRRQRRHVVAVTQPPLHQALVERMRTGLGRAFFVDDLQCGRKDLRVGLVEHDEDVGVAVLEVPLGLRLVVQTKDRRRRAAAEDHAAGLEAGGEGREAEGAPSLRRRQGVQAEACLGDDAERSLAADEELRQVRPGGGSGSLALGVHDPTVGQDHLEADDHVLDLPVPGGVLPRAAAGQPAADRREIHGLGPMAERVARPDFPQRRLQIRAERAGPHVSGQRGLVDVHQPVQRREVERDAAVHRDRSHRRRRCGPPRP